MYTEDPFRPEKIIYYKIIKSFIKRSIYTNKLHNNLNIIN